jgi:hypothetical protein
MKLRGSADNVAMFPDFVDTSLRIRSVRYVLVEAADEARSSYSFLTVAISRTFSAADIVWQDTLPPERHRRSHIALEGRHWVLRDGTNRVYAAHTNCAGEGGAAPYPEGWHRGGYRRRFRPSETWMKLGMLPRKSSSVCILTAALVVRKCAHGKTARQRSMVVESSA